MLTKTLKKKKTLLKKKKKILTKIEKKQVKYDTVSFQQIFDFYIVSYLYSKRSTCPEIQFELYDFCSHLLNIARKAAHGELAHAWDGGSCGEDRYSLSKVNEKKAIKEWTYSPFSKNIPIIKKHLKIKSFNIKSVTDFKTIKRIFELVNWEESYGGPKWIEIIKCCINLEQAIESKNIKDMIVWADNYIDLCHNSDYVLAGFTKYSELFYSKWQKISIFYPNLKEVLDYKSRCKIEDLLVFSSKRVSVLYNRNKQ